MKENTFRMLDLIGRGYIEEGNWSVETLNGTSTGEYFGTVLEVEMSGRWLVVYISEDASDYLLDEMPAPNASMELAQRDNGHMVTLNFYSLD